MSTHILDTLVTVRTENGEKKYEYHPDYYRTREEVLYNLRCKLDSLIVGFLNKNKKTQEDINESFISEYSRIVKEFDKYFNFFLRETLPANYEEENLEKLKLMLNLTPSSSEYREEFLEDYKKYFMKELPKNIKKPTLDNILELMRLHYVNEIKTYYKALKEHLSKGIFHPFNTMKFVSMKYFYMVTLRLLCYVSTF